MNLRNSIPNKHLEYKLKLHINDANFHIFEY